MTNRWDLHQDAPEKEMPQRIDSESDNGVNVKTLPTLPSMLFYVRDVQIPLTILNTTGTWSKDQVINCFLKYVRGTPKPQESESRVIAFVGDAGLTLTLHHNKLISIDYSIQHRYH